MYALGHLNIDISVSCIKLYLILFVLSNTWCLFVNYKGKGSTSTRYLLFILPGKQTPSDLVDDESSSKIISITLYRNNL